MACTKLCGQWVLSEQLGHEGGILYMLYAYSTVLDSLRFCGGLLLVFSGGGRVCGMEGYVLRRGRSFFIHGQGGTSLWFVESVDVVPI